MGGDPLRIVVLGMMGRCPFGGQTWLYLNWLRGLQRLGHEVWYVEDDSVWPYHPARNEISDDCSYAVRHIEACLERIGLSGRWAFRLADRAGACWGLTEPQLDGLYRSCDVLLNVVGATDLRDQQLAAPFRVYVETDPVTAELRLAGGDEHTRIAFDNHHVLATYGENYGQPDCGVPLNGRAYLRTRQPVDVDLWPMAYLPEAGSFTTIANYRHEGDDVEYDGRLYRWSKHLEWERLLDLPRHTNHRFELALSACGEQDRGRLTSHGWEVVSPLDMSLDVFGSYPAYIRESRAELTVAKEQYARLRSGWFSERDACYLASGKPVVAQDTGFGKVIPAGEGLFAFETIDDALAAVEEINRDYRRHCRAARAIAEEHFEATAVAGRLLADLGLAAS
jgi:hypothetical protein